LNRNIKRGIEMPVKRLNIELPLDQYEFLRKEATARGIAISWLIRKLIAKHRQSLTEELKKTIKMTPGSVGVVPLTVG